MFDALLRFGGNFVGPLIVELAVRDEQRANFLALFVFEVVDAEVGIEPAFGPFD